MAVFVRTCCCGCDLRTGILLIGMFCMLLNGFALYNDITGYRILEKETGLLDKLPIPHKYHKAVLNLSLTGIAFAIISVLVNLSLLCSYGTRNRYLAYPWIFWEIFYIFYTFGVTIFFMVIWDRFSYVFVVNIFSWVLWIYFIFVVYSYTEYLRADPSAFEPGTMMQPPPYVMFGWMTTENKNGHTHLQL